MAGSPKKRARREAAGLPVAARIEKPNHPKDCPCTGCRGFAPGNDLARTHGGYVSDLRLSLDPDVVERKEKILATQPVGHPCDEGAAERLAMIYVRLERTGRAMDELDTITIGRGQPLGAYVGDKYGGFERLRKDWARWHREALRLEEAMGRTPGSRARLGLHLALGKRAITLAELHERAALEEPEES